MFLQAALNGSRAGTEAEGIPVTREAILSEAHGAVQAGADSIHVHVRDAHGKETLAAAEVAALVGALRARCPGVPIGVSTGAWIARDPDERLRYVHDWDVTPDFASVNMDEEGAVPLVGLLCKKGVGIEAGLANVCAAEVFVAAGLARSSQRILLEPEPHDARAALEPMAAIEAVLGASAPTLPRLLHGYDATAWDRR